MGVCIGTIPNHRNFCWHRDSALPSDCNATSRFQKQSLRLICREVCPRVFLIGLADAASDGGEDVVDFFQAEQPAQKSVAAAPDSAQNRKAQKRAQQRDMLRTLGICGCMCGIAQQKRRQNPQHCAHRHRRDQHAQKPKLKCLRKELSVAGAKHRDQKQKVCRRAYARRQSQNPEAKAGVQNKFTSTLPVTVSTVDITANRASLSE